MDLPFCECVVCTQRKCRPIWAARCSDLCCVVFGCVVLRGAAPCYVRRVKPKAAYTAPMSIRADMANEGLGRTEWWLG